jgi:hypothetical protein
MAVRSLRGLLVGVTAVAAAAAVLGACGGDGHEYVSNTDAGMYARVPDDWTVIEPPSDEDPNTPDDASDIWVRVFDSSDDPTLDHLDGYAPEDPLVLMQATPLTLTERDDLDYSALRSGGLGVDPINVLETLEAQRILAENSGEQVPPSEISLQLLDSSDLTTDEGYRGERVVFRFIAEGNVAEQLAVEPGADITIDHSAVTNPATTQVLSLTVVAQSDAYDERFDEISDIVESWTVEEPR